MKTIELYRKLGQLVKKGHGDRVIQIMDVQEGVTFAVDVQLVVAANIQDDGFRVWIIPGDTYAPEWDSIAHPKPS